MRKDHRAARDDAAALRSRTKSEADVKNRGEDARQIVKSLCKT
jgi:hypothetical protein